MSLQHRHGYQYTRWRREACAIRARAAYNRQVEAVAAVRQAVTIYRELAAASPDRFLPDLAMSLRNLAVRLGDLGWREEALAEIEEAVTIYRELAVARPDAFRPGLAASLHNQAVWLDDVGRREEARTTVRQAVAILEQLATRWPHAYRQELKHSLQIADRLEYREPLQRCSPRVPKK